MQYQTSFSSHLGFLILKSDGQSITVVSFSENDIQVQNSCEVLEKCQEQLDKYFSGKLLAFDLPLSPEGTEFQQKVWAELLSQSLKSQKYINNRSFIIMPSSILEHQTGFEWL